MAALPIRDRAGNTLVGFHWVEDDELVHVAARAAMPSSLVVVIATPVDRPDDPYEQ